MKKDLFLLLITLLLPLSAAAQEIYAELSSDQKTLTFYYDTNKDSRSGTVYEYKFTYTISSLPFLYFPDWCASRKTVTKAVFDQSMSAARPSDCKFWFFRFNALEQIENFNYLNTEDVEDMFNMFYECESLTSLDVSHFDTRNVTSMSGMFYGCKSLTSLDLSHFDTRNVTAMSEMFSLCHSLTSIDVSNFDTRNVINMVDMFSHCESLTLLDLTSFNTTNLTKMIGMFAWCTSLKTIYVDEGWDVAGASETGNMFRGCSKLIGGQGTTYDENHTDGEYAHIDDGPGYPGYLSELFPYVNYNESTLTFYKDPYRDTRPGTTYTLNSGGHTPDWYNDSDNRNVKRVVFDKSFAKARPTTTFGWFVDMSMLESITGMKEYLNTSEVENMFGMFFGCSQLKSVDLSNFDTEKVTMTNSMFNGCSSLTSLDLSSFNTASVTDMAYMFASCGNLKTIYVGKDWSTQNAGTSVQMFDGCTKLVGGKGTKYDAEHTNKAYAHVDGGTDNPGYLTQKQMGDVNGDSNVNSADVQKVYALMAQGADGNNHPEADVNGDGNVNSADIQKIYSIMATGKKVKSELSD